MSAAIKICKDDLLTCMMLLEMDAEECKRFGISQAHCRVATHSILSLALSGRPSYKPWSALLDMIEAQKRYADAVCAHNAAVQARLDAAREVQDV